MTPLVLRLRELREKAGLSQAELARRAGVAQSAISKMEAGGTKGVDFTTLERLAGALALKDPRALIGVTPRRRKA
jgi:transcriptional regulator with XRE-family HTH domain